MSEKKKPAPKAKKRQLKLVKMPKNSYTHAPEEAIKRLQFHIKNGAKINKLVIIGIEDVGDGGLGVYTAYAGVHNTMEACGMMDMIKAIITKEALGL